ncbi:MAG: 1-acyl-sn-glycerol-3-phosphate acyltransferase [Myxococcales bacterium]|nr:1-acyl-sn-glycerol-3-phosphate acyltransferase [Myxococcales bacterium]
MTYRVLQWFLGLITRVFFRQVEVVGLEHVPVTGPVIFAGNHPNSLIDPVLIITTCGRKVHFAAKDTLFSSRLLRMVLRGVGAVPVARRDDHGSGKVDNDAAFTAMFQVLGGGGAIGIFPEGLSHDRSELAKLKTGAARLALGGAAHCKGPVSIVPCGLTFIHPKRFRSRVMVQYAEPIVIDGADEAALEASLLAAAGGAKLPAAPKPDAAPEPAASAAAGSALDSPERVRALTSSLDLALRRLTINAPDWDTVRALDVVRRLYQPQEISIEERVELARRFNTAYPKVADDPRVVSTMTKVRAYQQELDELGITDRELARDLSKLEIGVRLARHVSLVAFWLPMTAPGAPLHLPTVLFARIAGKRLTPRKDVVATTKLLIGLLLAMASYVVAVLVIGWRVGWQWALLAAAVLPLSGWATLRVLDRFRLVRRALGTLLRRLRFRKEVVRLRAQRAQLVAEVIGVVNQVRPADLALLFPPEHPRRVAEAVAAGTAQRTGEASEAGVAGETSEAGVANAAPASDRNQDDLSP